MTQRILLATTVDWPSAARLAGAFTSLGAAVSACYPAHHVLRSSRYLTASYRYRPLDAKASIAEAIAAAAPDLVIPCDDRALEWLLALDQFGPLLERSLGPLENVALLTARAPSMAAARQEGIVAPLTLAVDSRDGLAAALQQVGLPCVMKADGSWGGAGVTFVHDANTAAEAFARLKGPPSRLRSLVRAVKRADLHYLAAARDPVPATINLQSLICGRPATTVFAAAAGQVLAMQHMDVAVWSGAAGPATIMRPVRDPRMDEAARKMAARFRLNGLHGLDFVRDDSGIAHLIEINPRATQICHLALDADLPAALLGVPRRPPVTEQCSIALYPQLLTAPPMAGPVYRDIPWDDPAVLEACGGAGPDMAAIC